MLMEIYLVKELDKLDDWIEKIASGNKVMEGLHEGIQQIKDSAQEKILEVKNTIMKLALRFLKMIGRESFPRCNQ